MYCRNCGEFFEDDEEYEYEDDDINEEIDEDLDGQKPTYRGFCSEDCCQEYMAKIMLVAELSNM